MARSPALTLPVETIVAATPIAGSADDDHAFSRALLDRVAVGELAAALRIWRPVPALALTRLDGRRPGADAARAAAARAGLPTVKRLSGGHAVVLGPGSLCFGLAERSPLFEGASERYGRVGDAVIAALRRVGVDAEQGDVEREWCPGAWSIREGSVKLAGLAQRALKGAAWVEGVVELQPDPLAAELMVAVYAALELPLEPSTLGSVARSAGRNVEFDELAAAIVATVEL